MRVWAITGGRRGNDVLVLGVAKALGVEPQLPYAPKTAMALAESLSDSVSRRATRRCHRPTLSRPCAGKRAAGRGACALYRISLRRPQFFAFFQKPAIDPRHFDFVWAPHHDRLHGSNVTSTLLSPHLLTQETLRNEAKKWRARAQAVAEPARPLLFWSAARTVPMLSPWTSLSASPPIL